MVYTNSEEKVISGKARPETVARIFSAKKMFLKISQNSQENN